jgi:hypothetical protein
VVTQLRESVINAMLKLGLWPFAPKRVHDEIAAGGFKDVVHETYTTAGKDHLRGVAQAWVSGVMRALVPSSMVVTGEAEEGQAKEIVEGLVGEFNEHCDQATAMVNFGVVIGRKVD